MLKSTRRLTLVIIGLAGAGVIAIAAPPGPADDVARLAAEEVKVCEQAIAQIDTAVKNTLLVKPDDVQISVWDQRYLHALNLATMSKPEKIAAFEKLVTRAKDYEQRADAWVKSGQAMHSALLDARFRRLEAELALARIKAQ